MKLAHLAFRFVCLCILMMCTNCSDTVETPQLVSYTSSECQKDIYFKNLPRINNRITEHRINDEFQEYKMLVVTNCERTAEAAIEFRNDTLHLMHHGVRDYHAQTVQVNDSITEVIEVEIEELLGCDCAYELTYNISGLNCDAHPVTLNGKTITASNHHYKVRSKNPKFKIIENDTINLIDIYGLKQGLHKSYGEDGKLIWKINYRDDEPISGIKLISYNTNGYDRIELHLENKIRLKRKYYRQNKLVKVCDTKVLFDRDTNCEDLE